MVQEVDIKLVVERLFVVVPMYEALETTGPSCIVVIGTYGVGTNGTTNQCTISGVGVLVQGGSNMKIGALEEENSSKRLSENGR